jgi:hypothetical protein
LPENQSGHLPEQCRIKFLSALLLVRVNEKLLDNYKKIKYGK